jgi:hypothetical protein
VANSANDSSEGTYDAYDLSIDDGVWNLVGRPILRNKQELENYWRTALARISALEFKHDHAAWDERRLELNVIYEANLNGERKRACEIMQFDTAGRQVRGEALYGAII